jgi:voltage-gated sodium channel
MDTMDKSINTNTNINIDMSDQSEDALPSPSPSPSPSHSNSNSNSNSNSHSHSNMSVKVTNLGVHGTFPLTAASSSKRSSLAISNALASPPMLRGDATRKVKFKSGGGVTCTSTATRTNARTTATTSEPQSQASSPSISPKSTTSANPDDDDNDNDDHDGDHDHDHDDASYVSESTRRRRPRRDKNKYKNKNKNNAADIYTSTLKKDMDSSASSHASWNVTLTERDSAPFGIFPDCDANTNTKAKANANANANTNTNTIWFEKYMPHWLIVLRSCCGAIVLNDTFQLFMVLLIVLNSIEMGLATFDFIDNNPHMKHVFDMLDQAFLIAFTVEIALNLGYWGYQLFFDGWLIFDLFIVCASWGLQGVQVLRSIRIFRAFRLVVRIPILKSLVLAFYHVIPRMGAIVGLFSLVMYIFAVTTTILYGDFYRREITQQDYFGTLFLSLFTLMQFVTLEGWSEVVRDVMAVDPVAKYIFGLYITISAFILYSLVVAVVCDSFLLVESKIRAELKAKAKLDRQRRKALRRAKKKKRKNIFVGDDVDPGEDDNDDGDGDSPSNDKRDSNAILQSRPTGRPSLANFSNISKRQQEPPPATVTPTQNSTGEPQRPSAGVFLKGVFLQLNDPSQGTPPLGAPTRGKHPNLTRRSRRSLLDDGSSGNSKSNVTVDRTDSQTRRNNTDVTLALDEDDTSVDRQHTDVMEIPSPTVPKTTRTLASGELERKIRKSKTNKKRPVPNRIKRVQYRLSKLSKTQKKILSTLDDLCKEMESRNRLPDDEGEDEIG